jgi:hypothetical protein
VSLPAVEVGEDPPKEEGSPWKNYASRLKKALYVIDNSRADALDLQLLECSPP